jgi:MFS family permease
LPVGHRPFAAVLAANVISVAGDSLAQLGVPWYVLESTGSSARAGVVAFCALLPVAVSAWVSGPFIDRVGRRRVSINADMRLVRAASLYDGAARCAAMVGAALGGVLIITMGASHVLLVDAGTFGVSAVLVASGLRALPAARPSSRVPGAGTSHQGSFGESLGFLLRMPLLLGICLTTLAAQGLDQGWSSVLLPVDVREKLGSVLDLGMLETVFAACALAGALLYGAVAHRWRRRAVFAVAFLIVGAPRFAVAALTGSVAPLAVMSA